MKTSEIPFTRDGHKFSFYLENGKVIDHEINHPDECYRTTESPDGYDYGITYTDCIPGWEINEGEGALYWFLDEIDYMLNLLPDGWHELEFEWYFNSWVSYYGELEIEFDVRPVWQS